MRQEEPGNPFKTTFSTFDRSLAHGAADRDEAIPLSEGRFVVGSGGKIESSFEQQDDDVGGVFFSDEDYFGPFESINLGGGETLPVFKANPHAAAAPSPPPPSPQGSRRRPDDPNSFGPFQVVNLGRF